MQNISVSGMYDPISSGIGEYGGSTSIRGKIVLSFNEHCRKNPIVYGDFERKYFHSFLDPSHH